MWSPAFLSLSLTPLASHLYEAINTLFCGRPFVNYYLLSRRYSVTAAQSELGPNYGNYSHTSCPVDYRRHSQDMGTQVMGFARRYHNEVISWRSVIVNRYSVTAVQLGLECQFRHFFALRLSLGLSLTQSRTGFERCGFFHAIY